MPCDCRLSRDALYNLHELAYDGDFVHRITTFPDVEIFLYSPHILSTFQTLLSRCHCENLPVIQLSYDTTFNMGDFYLSVLLYRHTEFNESPVIPLSFLIHERKLNSTHTNFFTYMKSVCPELANSQHLLIVTDNEQAIRNSLRTVLPELRAFLCWNHLFQVCIFLYTLKNHTSGPLFCRSFSYV